MGKPTKEQRAELKKFINKWRPLLFLHAWDIDCHYMDSDHPHNPDVAIETNMQQEYTQAAWSVYPRYWRLSKTDRERCVVHELCHSVVVPLQHLSIIQTKGQFVSPGHCAHVDESVTQHLSNIVFFLKG